MTSAFKRLSPNNRRGIAAVLCAMAAFTLNDTFMKLATERLPVPEVILLRSGIAALLLFVILLRMGDLQPRILTRHPRILLRAFFEVLLIVAYVTALKYLPLGETTAVIQTIPLFMTAWAALVWREKVGLVGWVAVLGGFAGILLIVKPTLSGIEIPMLLAIVAAMAAAGRDLVTRGIARDVPSLMIALASIVASAIAGLVLSATDVWKVPEAWDIFLLGGAALVVTLANYAIILAYRGTEVAVVSPFRYTSVLFALATGFVVWGHVPDLLSWIGILIVVGAGLFTLTSSKTATHDAA